MKIALQPMQSVLEPILFHEGVRTEVGWRDAVAMGQQGNAA
jgi:hypothetical protein